LESADADRTIQGYQDGVFWERNTLNVQKQSKEKVSNEQGEFMW
jgi:site-specific DNA-methyltransferase (adenine-specific)